MPTIVEPIITNAGLAAAIAAGGLKLDITHVQLGTGAYNLNTAPGSPDYDRVALVAPVEARQIAAGYVLDEFATCRIDVLFAPYAGAPYNVREIGFWAGDPAAGGTLFAVYSTADNILIQRNMLDYLATFMLHLVRVPAGTVEIVFDPNLLYAAVLIAAHEAAADPHPQYANKATTNRRIRAYSYYMGQLT